MNPHSKGGHAAAGTQALGLPASPPPPFPRRTIVADYCRTCGCPVCSWGCAGGVRVYWRDRPVSATMDGKSEARSTTDTAVRRSELLRAPKECP